MQFKATVLQVPCSNKSHPRTHRNLTTSKKGLKGLVVVLFVLRTDTPKDKTTNKAILLSFRLPWTKVHLGSSGLWLLWSGLFDGGVGGEGQNLHSTEPLFFRTYSLPLHPLHLVMAWWS